MRSCVAMSVTVVSEQQQPQPENRESETERQSRKCVSEMQRAFMNGKPSDV